MHNHNCQWAYTKWSFVGLSPTLAPQDREQFCRNGTAEGARPGVVLESEGGTTMKAKNSVGEVEGS